MGDVKTLTDLVAGVEDPGGAADAVLVLQGGTRCTLARTDPRFGVWQRLLKGSQTTGLPVYVRCDEAGAAKTILPMAARRIEKLEEAAGDTVAVHILLSPSPHHLRTGHADYAAMRAVVDEAARSRQPVLLAVEPNTLEILSARKPAEGTNVVSF
jgi:hypothetical protein